MRSNSRRHRLVLGAALVAAMGLLGGCNEEERPLHFEKGRYVGPQNAPLSQEQLDSLRQRLNNERF